MRWRSQVQRGETTLGERLHGLQGSVAVMRPSLRNATCPSTWMTSARHSSTTCRDGVLFCERDYIRWILMRLKLAQLKLPQHPEYEDLANEENARIKRRQDAEDEKRRLPRIRRGSVSPTRHFARAALPSASVAWRVPQCHQRHQLVAPTLKTQSESPSTCAWHASSSTLSVV